jgi:CRISP-associated protein Cas1
MLNYGYTVLAALCHRSLLIHGLTPALGVKHMPRYRSTPLVFDLMEPFRPLKLMDAIDSVASSMARSYSAKSVEPFWVPEL